MHPLSRDASFANSSHLASRLFASPRFFSVSSVLRSLIATFKYGNRLGRLRTRGLVVMTSPLQGEGRRFNPGRVHSFLHQRCLDLYIVHRQYCNFARLCRRFRPSVHGYKYWRVILDDMSKYLWETREDSSFIFPGSHRGLYSCFPLVSFDACFHQEPVFL